MHKGDDNDDTDTTKFDLTQCLKRTQYRCTMDQRRIYAERKQSSLNCGLSIKEKHEHQSIQELPAHEGQKLAEGNEYNFL